ncbi:MAG: hypothetical protein P8164_06780 [Gammaproteobacteria bacterium]|jgi:hypothetical protein
MGRNSQNIIDGGGQPQVATNYQIRKYPSSTPPELEELTAENETYWRQKRLTDRIEAHAKPFTPAEMKPTNACVSVGAIMNLIRPDQPLRRMPSRTIWHSLYDQEAGRVDISFYLGETVKPDDA